MRQKAKIAHIATKIREAVLKHPHSKNFRPDMQGLCAISSLILASELKGRGFYSAKIVWGKVAGGDHCWVELNNHVIDITATQFGYREVEIFPVSEKDKRDYKNFRKMISVSYWNFNTWVDEEKPKRLLTKEIKRLLYQD